LKKEIQYEENKFNSIDKLRKHWESEKDIFKIKEIGGLQDFIYNILICKELFALSIGKESTKIEKRKKEITRETRKEGGRGRADIVIYINGDDIVIPVEIEKYGNISAGESQILLYQTD
jgi:hypothetical protein